MTRAVNSFNAILTAVIFTALTIAAPALAQSQHEQIVEAYGGEYDPDGLGQYVRSIVDRLEPHADLRRPIRHVTVLNTPVVNAFATPQGGGGAVPTVGAFHPRWRRRQPRARG